MGRPKGSKNKQTVIKEKEMQRLQNRVNELEKQYNSYDEVIDAFTDGFVMDLYNQGIIKTINLEELQLWFNNPDAYMEKIIGLLTYYYIVDGNIFQLYDLIFSLSDLNYRIKILDRDKYDKQDLIKIKSHLDRKVKHKLLTRDLLIQLAHQGTLLGTWLGGNKNPYFHIFNNLDYVYPYGTYRGEMIGVIDLEWLDGMEEEQRKSVYNNLSPLVTAKKYKLYQDNPSNLDYQLVILPPNKSLVARVHTLSRSQRLGIPFGTQTMFDIIHKQKLKDLEKAIANKIIKAIATLHFKGVDDSGKRVKKDDKKKVYAGVKKALTKNKSEQSGISVIAIPDFAKFEFPEMKNSDKTLDPKKYESIDNDITNATGISNTITNGAKGDLGTAEINLKIIYKKIGILLEQIEEIYNQLIIILLGEEKGQNYTFEYVKEPPMKTVDKMDALKSLQMQGYATKYILDMLGIDSEEFYEDSVYEIEDLKLREKIIPPQTSYTLSSKGDEGGAPKISEPTATSTIADRSKGE